MNITLTIKSEELLKALKEIECFKSFEKVYIYCNRGTFNLSVFVDEDTDEWYEGELYKVEKLNFTKFWRPFIDDTEELFYVISFIQRFKPEELVEIEFGDDFVEFRTSEIELYIDKTNSNLKEV